jgi:hypothetical protein
MAIALSPAREDAKSTESLRAVKTLRPDFTSYLLDEAVVAAAHRAKKTGKACWVYFGRLDPGSKKSLQSGWQLSSSKSDVLSGADRYSKFVVRVTPTRRVYFYDIL